MRPAEIVTPRFLLRPLAPDDATDRYSGWLDDAAAVRYIEAARRPHDVAQLKAYIAERTGRSDVLFLGIFTRSEGGHIGNIKYEPVDEAEGYAVMGILIGEPEWRGRDAAGEVITASADWLAQNRGIREVVLGVQREHRSAISAYERIGFRVGPTARVASRPDTVTMVWRREPPQRAAS